MISFYVSMIVIGWSFAGVTLVGAVVFRLASSGDFYE
jgi:hypothetical protein